MTLLSILIPTTPDRAVSLERLLYEINRQIKTYDLEGKVEIKVLETPLAALTPEDISLTTGAKRNWLVENCDGKYYAFIDSDDMISPDYLKLVWPGITGEYDCCSLIGSIYFNGKKGKPFLHSIKYKTLWEDDKNYFRPINHLNCVKKELVKDFKFQEKTWGEDSCWAMDVSNAGILKNEYEVKDVLYLYFCGEPKNEIA